MPELGSTDRLDDPSPAPDFTAFALALPDSLARMAMGLHISDADAGLLDRHPDWALTYYRQWTGEAVALQKGAPVALPRVLATQSRSTTPPTALPAAAPTRSGRSSPARSRTLRATAATFAAGTVLLAGLVGAGIVQVGASAAPPGRGQGPDPFPAGLAGPDAPAGADTTAAVPPTADREERLGLDLAAALKLDERTAAVPSVSSVVQRELVRIADLACLQGYDETMSSQVAQAVSRQPDLDEAAGAGVADAIARYCASATANR